MKDKTREILLEAFRKVKEQSGIALEQVDFELVGGMSVNGETDYYCAQIDIEGRTVSGDEVE